MNFATRPEILTRRDWMCALGVALLWRVFVLIASHAQQVGGDAVGYIALARSVVDAGVYSFEGPPNYPPSVLRAPLYSAFLALWMGVFHLPLQSVLVVQVLLSLGMVFLLGRCIERHRPSMARPALWLLALAPFEAFFNAVFLAETLATFLVIAAMTVPLLSGAGWRWFLSGVLWGLAALTRDVFLPFAVMAAVLLVLHLRWTHVLDNEEKHVAPRPRWSAASALLLGTFLVIAPWTFRNYQVTRQLVPISQGLMGYNLWVGTWERDGSWATVQGRSPFPDYAFDSPQEKADIERVMYPVKQPYPRIEPLFKRYALQKIKGHPLRTFAVWVKRIPRMWVGTRADLIDMSSAFPRGSRIYTLFKVACFAINALILLLGFIGLILAIRARDNLMLWFSWPIVLSVLVYMPFHNSEPRYSQPVYPLVIALAAYALHTLWQRKNGPSTSKRPTAVAEVA
jgi:hypothetical protein